MPRGLEAFERLLRDYPDARTVLDIGSGDGWHADGMRKAGKEVMTISLDPPADMVCNYLDARFGAPFDAIWACHVLEHQPDVGLFLRKCFCDLRDGGVFAVTVPPHRHEVSGGHLTNWNAGLLLYNLIVAGFDCSGARVSGEYDYVNISVIVRKRPAHCPDIRFGRGDLDRLARFFPVPIKQGFDGRLPPVNWH